MNVDYSPVHEVLLVKVIDLLAVTLGQGLKTLPSQKQYAHLYKPSTRKMSFPQGIKGMISTKGAGSNPLHWEI